MTERVTLQEGSAVERPIPERVARVVSSTPWMDSRTSRLPGDMLEAAVRRLGITCLMYAATFFVLQVAEILGRPGRFAFTPIEAITLASIGVSLVFYLILRRGSLDPALALDLGLVYWVIGALGIDLTLYNALLIRGLPMVGLSWVCVWVMMFPVIVPNRPGKILLGAFVCACMGPVSYLIAKEMTGAPQPPNWDWFVVFMPYYLSVPLAYLCSTIVYRLGRDVHRARELGSYELVELLGRGGMGEVWLAKHRLLTRPAAIKLIRPELMSSKGGEEIRRFEREAQATASLRSPHTVELYDFGFTENGSFYYAMEFLDGLDLERLVKQRGPMPAERVVYILGQACRSLFEAHSQGIIHRDIKPSNIFLCQLGCHYDFVKVLDFGLVKTKTTTDGRQTTSLTKAGVVTGTPAYLAPEMASGRRPADGRADLYSLGCVAYWLLTGRLVFEGPSALDIIVQHLQKTPVPPSARTELEVPKALDQIVLRCLAKNPEDRPADARVLAALLAACPLPRPWTEEDAERWWKLHRPGTPAAAH